MKPCFPSKLALPKFILFCLVNLAAFSRYFEMLCGNGTADRARFLIPGICGLKPIHSSLRSIKKIDPINRELSLTSFVDLSDYLWRQFCDDCHRDALRDDTQGHSEAGQGVTERVLKAITTRQHLNEIGFKSRICISKHKNIIDKDTEGHA